MAQELFIYAVFFEETKMKILVLATLFLSITGIINAETNMQRENITIISFILHGVHHVMKREK